MHSYTTDDAEFARLMHDVYTQNTFGHLQRAYTFLPKTEDFAHEVAVGIQDACEPCPCDAGRPATHAEPQLPTRHG